MCLGEQNPLLTVVEMCSSCYNKMSHIHFHTFAFSVRERLNASEDWCSAVVHKVSSL